MVLFSLSHLYYVCLSSGTHLFSVFCLLVIQGSFLVFPLNSCSFLVKPNKFYPWLLLKNTLFKIQLVLHTV